MACLCVLFTTFLISWSGCLISFFYQKKRVQNASQHTKHTLDCCYVSCTITGVCITSLVISWAVAAHNETTVGKMLGEWSGSVWNDCVVWLSEKGKSASVLSFTAFPTSSFQCVWTVVVVGDKKWSLEERWRRQREKEEQKKGGARKSGKKEKHKSISKKRDRWQRGKTWVIENKR